MHDEAPRPDRMEFYGMGDEARRRACWMAGTGKTLLARAVAHHTDCTFIRVSGSELVQKYIGEGSRMVRELFVMARWGSLVCSHPALWAASALATRCIGLHARLWKCDGAVFYVLWPNSSISMWYGSCKRLMPVLSQPSQKEDPPQPLLRPCFLPSIAFRGEVGSLICTPAQPPALAHQASPMQILCTPSPPAQPPGA